MPKKQKIRQAAHAAATQPSAAYKPLDSSRRRLAAPHSTSDSSYPEGQFTRPSHHRLLPMQASNSGHLCSHSARRGKKPKSPRVSFAVRFVCKSNCWIREDFVRWISSQEKPMAPGSRITGSRTISIGLQEGSGMKRRERGKGITMKYAGWLVEESLTSVFTCYC